MSYTCAICYEDFNYYCQTSLFERDKEISNFLIDYCENHHLFCHKCITTYATLSSRVHPKYIYTLAYLCPICRSEETCMKRSTFKFDYICRSYVESSYVNGVEDGVKIEFDRDDHWIRHIAYYKEGKMDGRIIWYYPDGRISSYSLYQMGARLEEVGYDKNGKITKEYSYHDGKKVGFHESYYDSGKLFYRYNDYEDGRYEYYHYYEDGTLKSYANPDIMKDYRGDGSLDREHYKKDGVDYVRNYYSNGSSHEMSWSDYMDAMR